METRLQNYQFGDFTLDLVRGCLLRSGEEVKLRPKVYETLKHLVEHSGQLISKQQLMRTVWPDAFVTDDSLVQCALELRRALDDRGQLLFKTVPRRGYVFTAKVTSQPAAPDSVSLAHAFDLAGPREPPVSIVAEERRHLPIPRTSLIGRDQDLAEIGAMLLRPDVRLLPHRSGRRWKNPARGGGGHCDC